MELEQEEHKKQTKKNRKRMSNYFTEYCNDTSIHGFKYLGEQKRSIIEKVWWLVTIIVSVICCAILICQTYNKWNRSPVIVSFATKQTPIWQIPFPAVTICPETKSRQSIFNFTELYMRGYKNLTAKEKKEFEYISLICDPRDAIKHLKYKTVNESVLEFLDEVSPSFSNFSIRCVWMGEVLDCNEIFTPILTDEGVCYTFNMLDRDELFNKDMTYFKDFLHHDKTSLGWSLEKGYAPDAKKDTYPRRALFSGAQNGLVITMLAYDEDLDFICVDSLQGYRILLHHPAEIPRVSQQYFRVPLNQGVVAAIKPEVMTTAVELQNYDPNERQCYFPYERKLKFFKIYTQQNCEIECLTNFTLQLCKCVDFHMPRESSTPICGPARIKCMKHAESLLLSSEIDFKLKELEDEEIQNISLTERIDIFWSNMRNKEKKESKKSSNCDCLQSCTSLSYSTETSQSECYWVDFFRGLGDPFKLALNHEKLHLSKMVLFFKDMQFISSERDELYGHTDFLANCGGLLGLFTGFSVISLVEIIYFLSLRLICNIRMHGRKFWSGTSDE